MDANNTFPNGCPFAPGSVEKVRTLQARARLRMPLFLPGDAVDCTVGSRRGGHGHGRTGKYKRPDAWRRLYLVAEGLRFGRTFRDMAQALGVSIGTIQRMAEQVRRMARLNAG